MFLTRSKSAMAPKLMKMIRVEAPLLREIMAEFLGTFILVVSLSLPFDSLFSSNKHSFARQMKHIVTKDAAIRRRESFSCPVRLPCCLISADFTNVTKPSGTI